MKHKTAELPFTIDRSKQPKRISVEVPDDFIQAIKESALVRRVTLKRYVIGAIMNQMAKDLNASTKE